MSRLTAKGFTLLELIGVLAVLGILAGALAPSVVQMLDEGYRSAEESSLRTIADALQTYVISAKRIPSEASADWSTAVGDYAAIPPSQVVTNDKRFARRLYIDRQFMSSTDQAFAGYQQTAGLAVAPYSPRMMLVSNLDGAISTNLTTHAQFQAVWDQSAAATLIESKKLMIERLNLAPLFHRLVLNNSNSAQASYRLEDSAQNAVAAATGASDGSRTIYVLTGTKLSLLATPYPSGTLLQQSIITADTGLRYQTDGTNWHWAK